MNKYIIVPFIIALFFHKVSLSAQKRYPILQDTNMRSDADLKKVFPYNIVLKDTAGNYFSSEHILPTQGKALVLIFWMTTCGPCRQELDAIKTNLENWRKEANFRIVAISMDFPHFYPKYIERVKKENWDFETFFDPYRQFCDVMPYGGLNGLPQVFVFNDKGEIIYHHHKYMSGDEIDLFSAIKKLK